MDAVLITLTAIAALAFAAGWAADRFDGTRADRWLDRALGGGHVSWRPGGDA